VIIFLIEKTWCEVINLLQLYNKSNGCIKNKQSKEEGNSMPIWTEEL